MLGPARLVKTITAIPKKLNAAPGTVIANVAKSVNPELQLEVELKKMFPLPFFPSRKIYARPDELILEQPLVPPVSTKLTPEQLRAIRLEEEEVARENLEYERSHIMSAPFRHMSRAFFSVFKNTGRTWTREGFMKLDVKGQKYKIDVTGGWALDHGRALDRLAVVRPS